MFCGGGGSQGAGAHANNVMNTRGCVKVKVEVECKCKPHIQCTAQVKAQCCLIQAQVQCSVSQAQVGSSGNRHVGIDTRACGN